MPPQQRRKKIANPSSSTNRYREITIDDGGRDRAESGPSKTGADAGGAVSGKRGDDAPAKISRPEPSGDPLVMGGRPGGTRISGNARWLQQEHR